jgi:hypothetical protein
LDEIEDVVSSVRRLVSVESRPRPVSRDLAKDLLVLTPALRIEPEDATDVSPLFLTARVKDEVPEASDPTPVLDAALASAATASPPAFEAEWEEDLWSEPEPSLSELALGAEEAEVVVESALYEPEPEPVAAGADPLQDEAPWAEIGDEWLEDAPTPADPSQADAVDGLVDNAAAEMQAKRPDVLKLSAEDMLIDVDGNPLTVLDEAALQQIIRQLIREELKGVLGERITQSVRKLVRAEINRALAAHALD